MDRMLRAGAVSYLNTKPLIYQWDRFAPDVDLLLDHPSCLADSLADGRLDVALIPSIEFFQNPAYRIVSDACIACRGPVLSVKLFGRKPAEGFARWPSMSARAPARPWLQILLHERYGLRPAWSRCRLVPNWPIRSADAVLLIGDRAMQSPVGPF